jgi:hypothetical protein
MATLAERVAEFPAETPDWEIAAALNARDAAIPMIRQRIAASDARGVLMRTTEWPKLVLACDMTDIPAELRGACILLRDAITINDGVDTHEEAVALSAEACLAGLVLAGIIAQSTKDTLMALTWGPQSWAEFNGLGRVTARQVGIVRGAVAPDARGAE